MMKEEEIVLLIAPSSHGKLYIRLHFKKKWIIIQEGLQHEQMKFSLGKNFLWKNKIFFMDDD